METVGRLYHSGPTSLVRKTRSRKECVVKRATVWLSILAVVLLLQPRLGAAQTSEEMQELRKEIEGVKKGQDSIQKELQEESDATN